MKRLIIAMLTALALTACQPDNASQDILAPVPELVTASCGYLHEEPPLDSAAFLPPPPTSGSAQQAADDAASEAMRVLEGSARWTQAAVDAELHFPPRANIQLCVRVSVTEAQTPALYRLLQRSLTDFGLASYPAKRAHQRQRPFLINGGEICTPDDREMLETDGSYPSGHSNWLGLGADAVPACARAAEALLARGRAYAQSRMVCNVHWLSDTEAAWRSVQPPSRVCRTTRYFRPRWRQRGRN